MPARLTEAQAEALRTVAAGYVCWSVYSLRYWTMSGCPAVRNDVVARLASRGLVETGAGTPGGRRVWLTCAGRQALSEHEARG